MAPRRDGNRSDGLAARQQAAFVSGAPTLTARPLYRQTFDVDADGWFGGSGIAFEPAYLPYDPVMGAAVSAAPWWIDPNHAIQGAGYLNLLGLKYADTAGIQDFTDLVFSFDLSIQDLVLPPGAEIYAFFQGIDQTIAWGAGDRVNYVNVANPISALFDANGVAHVEVHFQADAADWLALGSSFDRDDLYSVSANIANALASMPLDFGVVILLGNTLTVPVTGSVSLDNVVVGQDGAIRAAVLAGPAEAQLLGLDVDLDGGEDGVFDGGVIEIAQTGEAVTGSLSIVSDPNIGLIVDQNIIYLDQIAVAALGAGSDAHHLIVELSGALTDSQIELLISRLAFAPGDLAAGNVAPLRLSFADGSGEEAELDILVRIRAPIYEGEDADELSGTAGNEALRGGAGSDILHGLGGDDRLDGGTGVDHLFGGLGSDLYVVDDPADEIVELAGEGDADRIVAATSYVLAAGVSIEILSTYFNDDIDPFNLTGNELRQHVYGNAGANSLDGGGGGDVMIGFGGDDFFYIRDAADRVIETAGGGFDRVFAAASFTLEAGSEVEMLTTINNISTAALNLTGNARRNISTAISARMSSTAAAAATS